jgi:glycosyltransferase involved in cell wall biosynthesis
MVDTSKVKNLYIILNTPINSKSMSGGDKIFIKISEIIKHNYGVGVTFIGCPDGINLVKNTSKIKFNYFLLNNISGENRNIFITYFLRLLFVFRILFLKIEKNSVVVSASDFITDTIPLFILKLKYQKEIKIFSSMFLRKKFKSFSLKDLLFFLSQNITIFLTKTSGSKIFTNLIDIKFLENKGLNSNQILVLPGGVENFNSIYQTKKYDACFVGRISYQKGIDILLQIWSNVTQINPNLILALIVSGTDAEISNLKSEISALNLSNNIKFLGFLDNEEKYQVMSESKILLFPSRFESFGIVVAESLNLNVPVVSFELEALKLNYSGGIVYSQNQEEFIKNILNLLDNPKRIDELGKEGKVSISEYSWEKIAQKFLQDLV